MSEIGRVAIDIGPILFKFALDATGESARRGAKQIESRAAVADLSQVA